MNTFFIIILLIVLVIAIFVIYRLVTVKRQHNKINEVRFERIKELYEKLESGYEVTEQDIMPFAKNIKTRQSTFELLRDRDQINIFPKEYNTIIKGAESNLANWLEFPTELDACPDEIEYVKRVTIDFDGNNNFVHYEVFKYRMNEPHWAAKEGWILGVVGPYFDDSKPYDFPQATFSRVDSTQNKISPEDEVKWVHENISMKG